ncbi:MAG: thioredoxin domain-containing protein, partial [Verrucomicrobia bacterium]|nr:thioredoxin domain-containing protein [Verrucomicrobiota bacterium]
MKSSIAMLAIFLGIRCAQAKDIEWQPWSDSVFDQAKQEGRFVLLDLGTGWCHWCHVMDEVTYRDPAVVDLIRNRYVAVRVDADSRPDLANRYEDYGWPATIVFNVDGSEIVKRQGYIPPEPMASMLQAIIDDPSPGPSVLSERKLTSGGQAFLSSDSRHQLRQRLVDAYDQKNKGWGTVQKFLNWDTIEYCMSESAQGNTAFARMGRETLAAQLNLIDPVWGGVDQYSTDGDWQHPHFEKIMQMQAEDLRIYAEAFAFWNDPTYLETAKKIHGYLVHFLMSDTGAFYASQDADLIPGEHSAGYYQLNDEERRKRGIPRIDQHLYGRENGWAINALATLYAVTGDTCPLDEAARAARWIIAHRMTSDGGFKHDEKDNGGPYLADTLYLGRAFLMLYQVTAERDWLRRAEDAAKYISAHFTADIGYVTAPDIAALKSKPQFDENVDLARFTNLLQHYTGDAGYREMAEHAMKFVCVPEEQNERGFSVGGLLLADRELAAAPLHITIVG